MKQKLLNNFKLRALMLVAILCAGFTSAWGAENDVHDMGINFSQLLNNNASIQSTNIIEQAYPVKAVTINWRYNKPTADVVTIEVSVGGQSWGTQSVGTNKTDDVVFEGTPTTGAIVITYTNNAGSGTGKGTFYVNRITLTEGASAAPAYTITAQSNNNSYGTVSLSGSLITASPASGYTYADPAYTVSPANSATVAQEGNEFTVTPSANTTVTINFEAIPAYTVTLGDDNTKLVETAGGAGVTLPSRNAVGDYTFEGWSEENVTEETTTAPTIITIDETYYPAADITLYPVYTKTEGGESAQDASVTISDYASANDWGNGTAYQPLTMDSNISVGGTISGNNFKYYSSDATWRFYTNGSFTVTANNGATLSSVTLTILSGTLQYNNTNITSGTAVSVSGTSAVFNCTANAKITAISVSYSILSAPTYYTSTPSATQRVAQPTITIPNGAFVSSKLVTITTETDGAAIQYSTDGGNTWTNYSDPFSINATTTIQAKATKSGMDDSYVAEVTFTKETVLEGLAGLSAQTNTSNESYYVNLTNAQVTYVTGNNGFMEDATAGIYVYSASPVLNKVYNGIFQVTYQVYNGLPELKAITAVEGTINDGSDKAATEVALSTLTSNWNANLGRKVQVRATLTSAGDLADGYSLYKYDNGITTEGLKTYKLVGYPYINSNNPQFRIISAVEVQLQDNSIIMVGPDYTIDVSVSGGGEVNMTSAQASHGTLQSEVVTASTTVDASKYTFAGNVLNVHDVTEGGVIVIRYWVDADAEYNAVELIVPIYVKANPTIAYDGETESIAYGTSYTIDTDLISGGGDITVSSGNTAVATIDDLTITPVAVGSTTITINTAETDIWHAGTATFTLNVTAPEGKTAAAAGNFVKVTSTSDITDGQYLIVYEEGSVAFDGSLSGDNIDAAHNKIDVVLNNSKIAATDGNKAAAFTIDVTAGTLESASGEYIGVSSNNNGLKHSTDAETYTNTFSINDDGNAVITAKFDGSIMSLRFNSASGDSNDRFRYYKNNGQQAIQLYKLTDATLTATLNATTGYATYCSEYPLDFSAATDYTAWEITEISGSEITFNQITGSVKGGTGLFLMGTPGATITLTSAASTTELGDNLLIGTLAPTYVEKGAAYGLSGYQFVQSSSAGTIIAGKAYIPAAVVPTEVKSFTFKFQNPATGITETRTATREEVEGIFNLAGQRMSKMQKGINIVNGKKVLVK